MKYEPIDPETEKMATQVLDAAFDVHRELGPGLLEEAYEDCFAYELTERGIRHDRQRFLPVKYKEVKVDTRLRDDLFVENRVLVEVKSVETIHPVFEAQLMTYMRLLNCRLGFLLNFNVVLLKDGISRRVL